MKRQVWWIVLLALAGGCAEAPESAAEPRPEPEPQQAVVGSGTFAEFWNAFRGAVDAKDAEALAAMARFPFETRGPEDGDPVHTLDRAAFVAAAERLLSEPVYVMDGGKLETKTVRDIVVVKVDPGDKAQMTEDFARVESLEFRRVDGVWRFSRAYTEEP